MCILCTKFPEFSQRNSKLTRGWQGCQRSEPQGHKPSPENSELLGQEAEDHFDRLALPATNRLCLMFEQLENHAR